MRETIVADISAIGAGYPVSTLAVASVGYFRIITGADDTDPGRRMGRRVLQQFRKEVENAEA